MGKKRRESGEITPKSFNREVTDIRIPISESHSATAVSITESPESCCRKIISGLWKAFQWSVAMAGHVFTISELESIAWVILMTMFMDQSRSWEYKISIIVPVWQALSLMAMWTEYNLVIPRLEGTPDEELPRIANGVTNPFRLTLFLGVPLTAQLLDGFFTGFSAGMGNDESSLIKTASIVGGVVLAVFKASSYASTDFIAAFNAFRQKMKQKGIDINDLANQSGPFGIFYRHLLKPVAATLRAIYPLGIGAVHTLSAFRSIERWLGLQGLPLTTNLAYIAPRFAPLLVLTLLGGAYITNMFDMRSQCLKTAQQAGTGLSRDGIMERSRFALIRVGGRILSGEVLLDMFSWIKNEETRAKVVTLLAASGNAFGLACLINVGLTTYIVSGNYERILNGDEGKVLSFLLGQTVEAGAAATAAITNRYGLEWIALGLGIAGGLAQTKGKIPDAIEETKVVILERKNQADDRSRFFAQGSLSAPLLIEHNTPGTPTQYGSTGVSTGARRASDDEWPSGRGLQPTPTIPVRFAISPV
ncbi:MAG: hypothetical protein K0S08_1165 [Gammaproteobacteria bacterium]|jgi:hypothetical protein|nr:hypothetical protein [Gammaproteobacteria bacterium]